MTRVLVVDDEPKLLRLLGSLFREQGWKVSTASRAEEALALLEGDLFDLLVTDVRLPRASGIELLQRARLLQPELQAVVMTAYGTVSGAVEAMRLGAFDYLQKPFELEGMLMVVQRALEQSRLHRENAYLRTQGDQPGSALVGRSGPMRRILHELQRLAPTHTTVLILGESGVGKELVARTLHRSGPRATGPFIRVNCPAIPKDLVESELFGHVRGAFTGAEAPRKGRFELAHEGTIFLDELGDLPLDQQGKLLHVLESQRFARVGSSEEVRVDVRVLAATNHDLETLVARGRFRQDLYYRLKVFPLVIPPLRERLDDLPDLVDELLLRLAHRLNRPDLSVDPAVLPALQAYAWPGNVRELRNVLERAAVLCTGGLIRPEDLPVELSLPSEAPAGATTELQDLNEAVDAFKRERLLAALHATGWRKAEAASLLGISPRAMSHYVQRFDLNQERSEG